MAELDAMEILGRERLDGQTDRAKSASRHKSRAMGIDQVLQLMLDLRDERMDAREFEGTYGEARRLYTSTYRRTEAALRVKTDVY
eukprot:SAG11_NODE_31511_length_291_cov_0.812500_1_plen_84_part_10